MGRRGQGPSRFPKARIKKMMQADDEVGRINTNTPFVVSAAIEFFLADLLETATLDARQRDGSADTGEGGPDSNGRVVITTLHLKHAVQNNEVYDFLSDLVETVAEFNPAEAEAAKATQGRKKGKKAAAKKAPARKRRKRKASATPEDAKEAKRSKNKGAAAPPPTLDLNAPPAASISDARGGQATPRTLTAANPSETARSRALFASSEPDNGSGMRTPVTVMAANPSETEGAVFGGATPATERGLVEEVDFDDDVVSAGVVSVPAPLPQAATSDPPPTVAAVADDSAEVADDRKPAASN